MLHCLLRVSYLTVRYGESPGPALHRVAFEISESEAVAVLGESGAGKTTLARAVAGLLPSSAEIHGHIEFRGIDLVGNGCGFLSHSQAGQISLIPQEPELALNP